MLMKTISEETSSRVNFLRSFFDENPNKEPENLSKYYVDAERYKRIIDYVYRMVRMEISSILNVSYIAAYAYTENKKGLKDQFNERINDLEFKKIVSAGINSIA